jgi:hypothetical protein
VKRINCVCGHVIEATTTSSGRGRRCTCAYHPDLVGKVAREDILAQAEES